MLKFPITLIQSYYRIFRHAKVCQDLSVITKDTPRLVHGDNGVSVIDAWTEGLFSLITIAEPFEMNFNSNI